MSKGQPSTTPKVTVDRSRWGRGKMLADDGKMCVLGFVGRACGVPDTVLKRNIVEKTEPAWGNSLIPRPKTAALPDEELWPEWVKKVLPVSFSAFSFWRYVMQVNDATGVPDAWREGYLRLAFEHVGVELRFVERAA